jgi:hypothetical protein
MCVLFSAVRARSLQVGDDAVIPWFDNYITSCHFIVEAIIDYGLYAS